MNAWTTRPTGFFSFFSSNPHEQNKIQIRTAGASSSHDRQKMAESLIAHPSKATMVRLLRQVLLAAGLLSAACSASVIRPVDEARLASRELFYYYDIDTSMSIPCSKSFKSKKAKLPPPPPSKSSKSKMPPPPKYPKGCKQPKGTKSPKGKGKGFLPTKTPTEPKTKAPVPNSKRQCITSASALSSVLTLLCFCFS